MRTTVFLCLGVLTVSCGHTTSGGGAADTGAAANVSTSPSLPQNAPTGTANAQGSTAASTTTPSSSSPSSSSPSILGSPSSAPAATTAGASGSTVGSFYCQSTVSVVTTCEVQPNSWDKSDLYEGIGPALAPGVAPYIQGISADPQSGTTAYTTALPTAAAVTALIQQYGTRTQTDSIAQSYTSNSFVCLYQAADSSYWTLTYNAPYQPNAATSSTVPTWAQQLIAFLSSNCGPSDPVL